MLTIKELSAWLNIKPSTLYLWASQGKIPCHRIHGLIRFEPEAIQAWLKGFVTNPVRPFPLPIHDDTRDLNQLIEAAKSEVYPSRHGETRPKSGLIQKEDADGAV
jgi:excisionase family DNA binding protein